MALKPLNSVAGFSVGTTPNVVIYANADITTNNITTAGVANLNSISNVKMSGGTAGQVIQTDGAGNLSFVSISSSSLTNGNSNINVLANANLTFSSAGNANVMVISGSGANVTGYLTVSNTIIANNFVSSGGLVDFASNNANVQLGNVSNVFIDGGAAGQVLSTDGTGNLSWTSTANINEIENGFSNVSIPTANGNVYINANASTDQQWNFDTTGNLNTPGNYIVNGNAGLQLSGSSNYAYLTPNAYTDNTGLYMQDAGEVELYAGGAITLTTNDAVGPEYNWNFDTTGNLILPNNASGFATITATAGNAISIQTGGGSQSQIILNDSGNAIIYTAGQDYGWVFDATGNLTTSGFVVPASNVTYDLGNITSWWNNVWSSNFNGTTANISGNVNAGNLVTTGSGGNIVMSGGDIQGVGNITASGNIIIDNWLLTTGVDLVFGPSTQLTRNYGNLDPYTGGYYLGGATPWSGINTDYANVNGNIDTSGNINVTGNVVSSSNISGVNFTATGNITTTGSGGDLTMTGGDIIGVNDIEANTANFAGNVAIGNVLTNTIFGTDLTLYSTGDLNLAPTGNINANLSYINNVLSPLQASDAATKAYVDNAVTAGIEVHPSANINTNTNLSSNYVNGGTTPTWTSITTSNTLNTGSAHGLSVNDVIVFTSGTTGTGITPNIPYFVATVPSTTSIQLTTTWSGVPIALTDGSGLTVESLANSGVGATLTATTNGPLTSLDYTAALNDRVLVLGQVDQTQNGIYVVTQVGVAGGGGSPWILTRATDGNKYTLSGISGLNSGAYFLVSNGDEAGNAYVLSTTGTIVFGTTTLQFSQFSQIAQYQAGTGLSLSSNLTFSISNTLVTTGSYGNGDRVASFTVNQQGQLTLAANVPITSNAANLTGTTLAPSVVTSDLTAVGTLANLSVSGNANIGNIGANNAVFTLVTGTLTTNAQPNITSVGNLVGLDVTGNTSNAIVEGLVSINADGVYQLPQNPGVMLHITGQQSNPARLYIDGVGTNNYPAVVGRHYNGTPTSPTGLNDNDIISRYAGTPYTTNGWPAISTVRMDQLADEVQTGTNQGTRTEFWITPTGSNVIQKQATINTLGLTVNANFYSNNANLGNLATANYVGIGNSTITSATANTSSITANQTISSYTLTGSGVTGVEWLVKGVDSTGSKYSVATVQAVTDGTNADYSIYGTVQLNGFTGALAVNVVGSAIKLQVTPASSNTTTWTTQFRLI